MIVTKDGGVAGSIDRAALEELEKAEAGDEAPADAEVEAEAGHESLAQAEVKPSMALTKDELVDLAEAAGLGERDDLQQFTKQELVDELTAEESEGEG